MAVKNGSIGAPPASRVEDGERNKLYRATKTFPYVLRMRWHGTYANILNLQFTFRRLTPKFSFRALTGWLLEVGKAA